MQTGMPIPSNDFFTRYVIALAVQVPVFLVYLAGFILAIVRKKNHSKASVLTLLAIMVLFLNAIFMTGMQLWLPRYLLTQGNSPRQIEIIMNIVSLVRNLIAAVGFAAILMAVFSGRHPISANNR